LSVADAKVVPTWTIVVDKKAAKSGLKLDKRVRSRIFEFLDDKLAYSDNPRDLGKALSGDWAGHWRYRVGDYRIICKIDDEIVTVLVIEIGHRREIYR
jgi:mRNA interferase RelE/StbE